MEFLEIQGVQVPVLGLGTWAMRGSTCTQVILQALDLGYRHIDTAQMYGNENAVGNALTHTAVPREEVFLTTKIYRSNLEYENVLPSVQQSLEELQTEYIDLLLIHWPSGSVPIPETVEAMNELQDAGAVKHIGVSNFSVSQMQQAMEASETPVLTNQVQYHPFKKQQSVLEFCSENDVMLTAYSPLAKGRAVRDNTLGDIGAKYGKSAAQVALRWLIQQDNVSAIPKASKKKHLQENIDIFDFELSIEDIQQILDLQGGLIDRMRSIFRI